MRDFFKSELESLKAKTGLNQYENLSAMPDAPKQFKILFDSLEMVRAEFHYIPDDAVKQIVQEQIVREVDFTSLNSRVLWKWLNSRKDFYWAQYQSQVEKQAQTTPVPFEALPEALQKEIEAFKAKLLEGGGMKAVPPVTQAEIDAIKREDEISQEGQKSLAIEYRQKSVERYNRKMEIIKEKGLDKVDLRDLKTFDIEGQAIHARTKEEAEEIWIAVYSD